MFIIKLTKNLIIQVGEHKMEIETMLSDANLDPSTTRKEETIEKR